MIDLRPYQVDALQAICRGCVTHDRQLAVLPTGAGKTILFSHIAQRFQVKRKERTLILAHRDKLIEQAVEKLHKATGIFADIEKGKHWARLDAPVVVASVQTLRGDRLLRWPRDHFGIVVADEAHHALAASWQSTLGHFDQNAKVLGVTATPVRGDKQNLGKYFQNIAYEISIMELIDRGFLCPIKVKTIPLQIDLSGVQSEKGDYDAAQLAAVVEPLLRSVVQELKKCASDRKILIFLPMIKTSKLMVQILNEEGMTARHVDGEMKDSDSVLKAYHRNEFQVLCNAMLLTEGYDQPDINCVVSLRATRSTALYTQAVGRGTRISPETGKTDLLLLDFLWLHERHNLVRPAHLVAKNDRHAALMMEAIGEEEVDLLECEAEACNEMEAALVREAIEAQKKAQEKTAEKSKSKKPVDLAKVAEILKLPGLLDYEAGEAWESREILPFQAEKLETFRVSIAQVKNMGHAKAILAVIYDRFEKDLASFAQIVHLDRTGHPDPANCSRGDAKMFLDAKWNKSTEKIKNAIEVSRSFLSSKWQNPEHVFASDVTK